MSENSVFDRALLCFAAGILYVWTLPKTFAFFYSPPLSSIPEVM